jgi:hypothetical protein
VHAAPGWEFPAKEAVPSAANPGTRGPVMAIAEELRCLVCQNETIAASHADLAVDLRKQIAQARRRVSPSRRSSTSWSRGMATSCCTARP